MFYLTFKNIKNIKFMFYLTFQNIMNIRNIKFMFYLTFQNIKIQAKWFTHDDFFYGVGFIRDLHMYTQCGT